MIVYRPVSDIVKAIGPLMAADCCNGEKRRIATPQRIRG
jgi:hypothetical protein